MPEVVCIKPLRLRSSKYQIATLQRLVVRNVVGKNRIYASWAASLCPSRCRRASQIHTFRRTAAHGEFLRRIAQKSPASDQDVLRESLHVLDRITVGPFPRGLRLTRLTRRSRHITRCHGLHFLKNGRAAACPCFELRMRLTACGDCDGPVVGIILRPRLRFLKDCSCTAPLGGDDCQVVEESGEIIFVCPSSRPGPLRSMGHRPCRSERHTTEDLECLGFRLGRLGDLGRAASSKHAIVCGWRTDAARL